MSRTCPKFLWADSRPILWRVLQDENGLPGSQSPPRPPSVVRWPFESSGGSGEQRLQHLAAIRLVAFLERETAVGGLVKRIAPTSVEMLPASLQT